MEKSKHTRLNLVINENVKGRIKRLQKLSGGESLAKVISRALAIYEELLTVREEGGSVIVESHGKKETLKVL